jgi:XTP/dITP diphosphohydrolase
MRLIIATSNPGKLAEFREALDPLGWQLEGLDANKVRLPPEDGSTYEENAALKAASVASATGVVALADDSGLEVEALGNEPGVYSARYGHRTSDLERNLFLLENLKRVPPPRRARFVSVLALAFPEGHIETYRGEVEGEILEGPSGEGGFGYDPLFLVPSLGRTFGQLSLEEKRRVSHRGRALEKLLAAYRDGPPRRQTSRLE